MAAAHLSPGRSPTRPSSSDGWGLKGHQQDTADAGAPTPGAEVDAGGRAGRRLLCAACGAVVTSEEWRLVVEGAHEHTFANPHGFVFRIRCFDAAPGCVCVGRRSREFAWFAGTGWRVAACRGCGWLLGWHFAGEASDFFGLIANHLAPATGRH